MIFLKTILAKIGGPALIAVIVFGAGMFTQHKVFTRECPDCNPPACNCPEPTVSVQPFDVEKIKNLKAFTYQPAFTGEISVAGVDSAVIKRYIEQAITKAINKIAEDDKKKKRKGLFSWLDLGDTTLTYSTYFQPGIYPNIQSNNIEIDSALFQPTKYFGQ